MEAIARQTLEKSYFFLDQAKKTDLEKRDDLKNFIEAAIVFARSVTFHLQKEFADYSSFKSWYESWQTRLAEDPVCKFFKEKRNFILKEGPIEISRQINILISESINISSHFEAQVIRGQPWYKRSLKILFEDFRLAITTPIHRWRHKAQMFRKRHSVSSSKSKMEVTLRFHEPGWMDDNAFDVLVQYLSTLEEMVSDAEKRFMN